MVDPVSVLLFRYFKRTQHGKVNFSLEAHLSAIEAGVCLTCVYRSIFTVYCGPHEFWDPMGGQIPSDVDDEPPPSRPPSPSSRRGVCPKTPPLESAFARLAQGLEPYEHSMTVSEGLRVLR